MKNPGYFEEIPGIKTGFCVLFSGNNSKKKNVSVSISANAFAQRKKEKKSLTQAVGESAVNEWHKTSKKDNKGRYSVKLHRLRWENNKVLLMIDKILWTKRHKCVIICSGIMR